MDNKKNIRNNFKKLKLCNKKKMGKKSTSTKSHTRTQDQKNKTQLLHSVGYNILHFWSHDPDSTA